MSDYLTIEEIKEKMRGVIFESNSTDYQRGYNAAIQVAYCAIDRLEPSDAKLRRVREEVESMMAPHIQLGVGVASHPMVHKGHLLEIIDSHLTTSEPEVDEELEEVRKKFPVGRKFTYERGGESTVKEVNRADDNDIYILCEENETRWWYSKQERHFRLAPTEAEKLRKEAEDLIEKINNAVRNLGE